MSQLKALKTITALSLFSNNIQNIVDQLSALSVMSFGPIVACTALAKDKVVRTEEFSIWPSSNRIHGSRLQINKNSSWDILSTLKKNHLVNETFNWGKTPDRPQKSRVKSTRKEREPICFDENLSK